MRKQLSQNNNGFVLDKSVFNTIERPCTRSRGENFSSSDLSLFIYLFLFAYFAGGHYRFEVGAHNGCAHCLYILVRNNNNNYNDYNNIDGIKLL